MLSKRLMAITFGIVVSIVVVALVASQGYGITGLFYKAFDKSLSPGEYYERNITVRNYYNLSVRFQKEGSSGYLGFDDNSSVIELKSANGTVIKSATGVLNGRIYMLVSSDELSAISTASAYSIDEYADITGQSVAPTFSGTKAYITITVHYRTAMIYGYITDELTGESVEAQVHAFEDGADPNTATAVITNSSGADGRYQLSLDLNSSKAMDIYVKDYDVS